MEKQRAQIGIIPGATEVYDFLLAQSQSVVQNTNTAPTYWMCLLEQQLPDGSQKLADWATYPSNPGTCPTVLGYQSLGPYYYPYATNTSDARMLFWDNGSCP
jgi:hypothetical protein